jgi:hypothetical protein
MNKKYTFWELCSAYHKIEVPIIQRDYAQGRSTPEVQRLRKKFVDDYLIASILKDEPIELDFVYGSILPELKGDEKQKIFIPLDGQQRLTTLFLLHFFIAIKENRLNEIKEVLQRFSYETRPSAHDFCKLLLEVESVGNLSNIKSEIEDSVWFNEEWKNDPTVSGMLNMLKTLSSNENLINAPDDVLDKLIGDNSNLVTFYFTDLDEFGLTENLYIRMNARGKMLTEFENFKSEFSKIIRYNHSLLEKVKDKIEYEWVDNLWDYRDEGSYIIDSPFMEYLRFITEMLYFKDAEFKAKSYENDFLDFRVLKEVYANEENLKFLIFSFDFIKDIKFQNESVLWDGESLHSILKDILSGRRDINQLYVFFSTLLYSFREKPKENLSDFIRVIRNLIENTLDNSRREWPRLIASLQNLISDDNVYKVLAKLDDDESKLIGFNLDQRKEEVYKANLFLKFDEYKELVCRIEDHRNFEGKIRNILIIPFVNSEEEFVENDLQTISYEPKYFELLEKIFEAYKQLSKKGFNKIWGNMLITGLYSQTYESRLVYSHMYREHPSILIFSKKFAESKLDLTNYLLKIQKKYILNLERKYEDFSEIRHVKDHLYLYYIITERIYEMSFEQFFKNDNYNFGWLKKETGYKSLFSGGIEDCQYFPSNNPIFQVYNQQFRYNLGLNKNNTLNIEIVGGNKKRNPFDLVKNWASQN